MDYLRVPMANFKSTISNLRLFNLLTVTDEAYCYPDDDSVFGLPIPMSPLSLPASAAYMMQMNPTKNNLPLVTYGDFQDRQSSYTSNKQEEEEEICAICLNGLERKHEMRDLPNCSHVFHGDCLDKWMDQHQITCPTCRSNLLPHQHHQHQPISTAIS